MTSMPINFVIGCGHGHNHSDGSGNHMNFKRSLANHFAVSLNGQRPIRAYGNGLVRGHVADVMVLFLSSPDNTPAQAHEIEHRLSTKYANINPPIINSHVGPPLQPRGAKGSAVSEYDLERPGPRALAVGC